MSRRDFFVLVTALAVPFWLIGGKKLPLPVNLPASALTAFVPAIAAGILVYRESRMAGVSALLRRAVDFRSMPDKAALIPALVVPPLIYTASYGIQRLSGAPLPDPVEIPWQTIPAFLVLYGVSAAGEELGWTAYAYEPMENQHGEVKAGFLLGVLWALWHFIGFLQTGNPLPWVLWQCLKTVAMRMMLVHTYNRAGKRVSAAILFHTTDNVSWSLFPNYGSHYHPAVTALVYVAWALLRRKRV